MPQHSTAQLTRAVDTLSLAVRRSIVRRRTPRYGYIGWVGHGNLGDDAMYQAARGLLPAADFAPYEHPRRERSLARLALSGRGYFSSVVLGGGTVITPRIYPALVREALAQGLPVWALGSGVGSCGFEMAERVDISEWKDYLEQFTGVGVRGPRSKAALNALGVGGVEVVGDLALSLARPYAMEQSAPPRFAINIALPAGQHFGTAELASLTELEAAARHLVSRGWEAVPIAMHTQDVAPTQALLSRIGGEAVAVHVPQDADEFLGLVGGCSLTVAVRLHAAVLSCCAGVPPLMLGYRDKCLDFMESMGLADWCVDLYDSRPGEVYERTLALSDGCGPLRAGVLGRAQEWQGRLTQYVQRVSGAALTGARPAEEQVH